MTASSLTSSQLPLLQHIYMTEPHECVWSSYPFISSTGCSDVTYSIIWCVRQIVHFSAASSDRSADGNMLPYCISSDRFTLLPAVPAERGVTLVNHYQFQQTVSVNSGRNATPLFFLLPKYFTDCRKKKKLALDSCFAHFLASDSDLVSSVNEEPWIL